MIDDLKATINVTAEYLDRISKGDIPPTITDTSWGDFNEISYNLNGLIDVFTASINVTAEYADRISIGDRGRLLIISDKQPVLFYLITAISIAQQITPKIKLHRVIHRPQPGVRYS